MKKPNIKRVGKIALVSTIFTFFGAVFLAILAIFIRRKKRKENK